MDKANRNDYDLVTEECAVYSKLLGRMFYGATITDAQLRRDEAEHTYYRHHKYDLYPVGD